MKMTPQFYSARETRYSGRDLVLLPVVTSAFGQVPKRLDHFPRTPGLRGGAVEDFCPLQLVAGR